MSSDGVWENTVASGVCEIIDFELLRLLSRLGSLMSGLSSVGGWECF